VRRTDQRTHSPKAAQPDGAMGAPGPNEGSRPQVSEDVTLIYQEFHHYARCHQTTDTALMHRGHSGAQGIVHRHHVFLVVESRCHDAQ
jgi:hypothetical protein